MFLDHLLAWITAISGVLLLLVIAGPGSLRPLNERLLVWAMAVSLIGASVFRLVEIYEPQFAEQAVIVGYTVMAGARFMIAIVALYMTLQWVWSTHPEWRTPVEVCGDLMAGHRRWEETRRNC